MLGFLFMEVRVRNEKGTPFPGCPFLQNNCMS